MADNPLDKEYYDLPKLEFIPALPTAWKWGVISALFGIVNLLVYFVLDIDFMNTKWLQWVGTIPMLVFLYLMFRDHKTQHLQGYLPVTRALKLAVLMGLVMGLLTAIFNYLYFAYINPNAVTAMIDVAEKAMEQQELPEDKIEEAMKMTTYFINPLVLSLSGIISTPLMTTIFGLIVALFMRKDIPEIKQ